MDGINLTGIEIGEEDMYRLMKERTLAYVA